MNKIYQKFLFLISSLSLMVPISAQATHVVGADISWQSLGNDTFEIIAHGYRDCNGIPLSGTGLTYFTPNDTCVPSPVAANPNVCCGTDITPVCNRSCDRCISNPSCVFPYGIEEFTITAKVYLSSHCCNYTIAWEESARSSAITTGAANQDFYIEDHLNRCIKPTVSSPYFTGPPLTIFCVNQCVIYNPGVEDDATDSLGRADSLSYSFGSPQSAPGSTIPYNTPYSNDAPLIYAGTSKNQPFIQPYCYGFHMDSTNGDIKFKAIKQDITVLVVIVEIYRRDSAGIERIIGNISRDVEIIAMSCPPDIAPILTGINGGSTYSMNICSGHQTCFNVKAYDLDTSDTTKLVWNNPGNMKGATFTVTSKKTKWPIAEFCWTPTSKNGRSYPYNFVVTAIDDACPVPAQVSRAFSIYVSTPPLANYSAKVQKCGLVNFQASEASSSPSSIVSYVWTGDSASGSEPLYINGKSGTYYYNQQKKYYYTLTVTGPNGCSNSYRDSITITNIPEVQVPKDTGLCSISQLNITAIPSSYVKPYTISWNTGDTGTKIQPYITKDTLLVAEIKDATGCMIYDTMHIKILTLPKPDLGPDQRGCWGFPVTLTTGLPHEPVTNWLWILGTDTVKTYHGDTISVKDSGTYIVTVQDPAGCIGSDTTNVYFNPPVIARKVDTIVCLGDSMVLRAGYGGSGASYLWLDQAHNNRIVGTGPTFSFWASYFRGYGRSANLEIIISESKNGLTCSDTGYYEITVNTPTQPTLGKVPPKCVSDPAFELYAGPPLVDSAHRNGIWTYPTNPSAIIGNFLYPGIMGETDNSAQLGFIHYIYTNTYGCITDDSIKVTISRLPDIYAGDDTSTCAMTGKYLLNNSKVTPTGGTWFPLKGTPSNALVYSKYKDSVFFDWHATGITDTIYGFVYNYTAPYGTPCSNSDTVYIKVVPYATHPVLYTIPAKCMNDPAIQLYASPPYVDSGHENGFWTYPRKPSAIVNNYLYPNIMGETDNNPKLGYIHYIYQNPYRCVTDDSIKVNITGLPQVNAGPDTTICITSGKYLLSNKYVTPNGGTWFPMTGTPANAIVYSKNNDSVYFDPAATGTKNAVYGVEYYYKSSASLGCSNSDTVLIKVVQIPNANWTMNYTGDSAYFHAQDSSLGASSYHWDFGDGNTGIGHSPKHLYSHSKSYTVSLRLGAATGCINSFDSTVNITKSALEVFQADNYSVQVFPNPFSSSTTLQYTLNKSSKVTIGLFDITGKQIAIIRNETLAPGDYRTEINAEKLHLSQGVYLLKFMTDDGFVSRQIVKL